MTTLPAKAGSLRLVPEASALTGASRAPHRAPPHVSARRLDPSPRSERRRPSEEEAASLPVFLPSRQEVVSAILTAEHLKEPKLPRARDTSYPRAFLVEPPKHSVRVRAPGSLSHKRLTCDFFCTSPDAAGTRAYRRACLRHPHSPPGFSPEGNAEIFYGSRRPGNRGSRPGQRDSEGRSHKPERRRASTPQERRLVQDVP